MLGLFRGFVVVAVLGAVAQADPAADKARALKLFGESDKVYRAGDFEHAAELLRQAYTLYPEPILLYNLARALEGSGDLKGAIEQYEKYLAADTKVKDRGGIERRIDVMKRQLEAAAKPESPPPEPHDASPPVATTHVIVEPVPPSRLPWFAISAGVAVIGTGAGFGFRASQDHDNAGTAASQAAAQQLQDRAHTLATTANVLFATGGAIVLAGVIWEVVDRRRPDRITRVGASLRVAPNYVGLAWTLP